ncbi:TRAM domain-containing protein, partial [candidate division KSB1 bacterium]|nr:TRAM domain-containing protein [candidate division KSB1 bacterium]
EEIQLNQNYISEKVNRQLIGKKLEVLVDYKDEESDMFLGRSYGDAPSIDQVIQIDRPAEVGEFTTITVEDSTATELTGK